MTAKDAQPAPPERAAWRSLDGERLLAVFASMVEPLGTALPLGSEVVLHDLSLVPNSVVAIHGTLSGRKVGDRSNSMTLERITDIPDDDRVSYESVMADGRRIRSTTITVRDLAGTAVAALCINVDLTPWEVLGDLARSVLGGAVPALPTVTEGIAALTGPGEHDGDSAGFVRNLEDLAQLMISREIDAAGVPVAQMKKRHKVVVVERLRERGLFLMRDAVPQVAEALDVTRFTIYNYINEIEGTKAEPEPES